MRPHVIERSRSVSCCADRAGIDPVPKFLPRIDAGRVAVAPVEAQTPCSGELGIGDRDRFATFDRRLDGLPTRALGIAVGARTRQAKWTEFEPGANAVLEEHLDV